MYCSSNTRSGPSSVITFNLEATLQQQLINRPYLRRTFNYLGKLTFEEEVLHSYSKYPSKYLGYVNFSHLEQNFGNNEFIVKFVTNRKVSLSTRNLHLRNFISWAAITGKNIEGELIHTKIVCTVMFLVLQKAEPGNALKLLA